jgi:hypothetical protein
VTAFILSIYDFHFICDDFYFICDDFYFIRDGFHLSIYDFHFIRDDFLIRDGVHPIGRDCLESPVPSLVTKFDVVKGRNPCQSIIDKVTRATQPRHTCLPVLRLFARYTRKTQRFKKKH